MSGNQVRAGGAYVEVSLRDRVGKGLNAIERRLSATGRGIASLGGALAAGGLAAVGWPLKLAADMEQVAVSFEVMTGSAARGKQMLDEIKKFAASTPFGFTDLSDGAKTLLGYGVAADDVIGTLRLLGDVSGGDVEKLKRLALAYGQVQAKGRLMGQEVLQMVENGFNPLQQIAEGMAKQFGGLAKDYMPGLTKKMEEGGISSGMLTQAFVDATSAGGRFAGMMERQAGTGLGLLAQIVDNVTFGLTEFGTQLLESIKPGLKLVLGLATAMRGFVAANAGFLKVFGLVALGVTALGGVLAAVGLGAVALSTVAGGLALAWGMVAGAIAALFTPLGAVVALVGLAGVVAFNFRAQIGAALSSVVAYAAPVTDAIGRVYAVFAEMFSGIVGALAGGQLQAAAGIAWLGFVAAAWQGVLELGNAIDAGLGYLQSWIPGIEGVRSYVSAAFASMGQAILAGRWDLAGSIMMAKLRLVITDGWNAIANTWTGFSTVLGGVWDSIVSGIKSTWRNAVTEIAKWLVWLAEQAGFSMDGVKAELDRMNAAEQKQANRDQAGREQGRYDAGAAAMAEREKQAAAIRAQIAELEKQSSEAFVGAGSPSVADNASAARKQLQDAMGAAEAERAAGMMGGDKKFSPQLPKLAEGAAAQMKVESKGTFSAAAAGLFGLGNDAGNQTAQNTRRMVTQLNQLNNNLTGGATV